MKVIGKLLCLPFILFLVLIPFTSLHAQPRSEGRGEEETILVGRITYVQGKVLRYVPEEEDWVAIVKDTPFGLRDALHSERGSRAEIIIPNNTWARIDGDTEIRLIELRTEITAIEVASGVARFYNKGSDAVIEARTSFGYVTGPGETSFDLYVSDDSVEVVPLKGTVYFVHSTSETKFEVIAGSSSIFADSREVMAVEPRPDPSWHAWNNKMDALWSKRMRVRGKSIEYLPPALHYEGFILDEHGRWERVYYNGAYRHFWRPLHVSFGWTPFTIGRWIVWCGDHTWIPYEPFGYLTHHYGSWIFVGGFWYWAPPVPRIRVCIGPPPPPLFPLPFFWCPGRVAWIHFRGHVGWVPLAPWEPYYCYRRWGPRAIVVNNVNITKVNLNMNRYKNFRHAVVIDKKNLYNVNNYRKIRIKNINNAAVLNNYRVIPVVNNRIIKNYRNIRQKYNVTNLNETRKRHRTVMKGIHENQLAAKRDANVRATTTRENVRKIKRGRIAEGARIRPQIGKDRVAPVSRANRPVSQAKFDERELKRRARSRGENQGQIRSEGQKRWRKSLPKPVRGEAVRQEEERPARNQLREGRGRIPPRPEQKFQKRPERREKSQGKRLRQWHPGL